MIAPQTTAENSQPLLSISCLESVSKTLHTLSNKLLPILLFSELALRRCNDEQIRKHLEKIHNSADEARALIAEMRSQSKIGNDSSVDGSSDGSEDSM